MGTIKVRQSETILTFGAVAVLAVITELSASPEFKEALGGYATVIIFGMSVLGMWLRKYTTKPLEPMFKKESKKPLNPLDEAFKKDAEEYDLI